MKTLASFIILTALFIGTGAGVQAQKSTAAKPTILFVHGLWADGSSWSKVAAPLLAQGYKVIAVQNPTTSLEDDVAATKQAINRAGGDVILVGHSWGGFVISEAGNDPRVKALVYVAALMPDAGETIATLSAKAAPTQLSSFTQPVDGFITITREGIRKAFASDLPEAEQDMVFSVQQPASAKVFEAKASNAAWKQKPSWYVVATEDGAINPDLERLMAKRANAKTTVIKASHVPMVSQPKAVLNVVLDAVKSVEK